MTSRRISISVCFLVVLALLASAPVFASVARDAGLYADCDGYTVFVTAEYLDPGEVFTVDYFFLLEYQGMDLAGTDVLVEGQIDFVYQDDQPFEVAKTVTWAEELGAPLCGQYELILGAGVPDTRIEWTSLGGDRLREAMFPRNWDGLLDCSCEMGDVVCRSSGFWGNHSGRERKHSCKGRQGRNITQELLDAVGFIGVCGEMLDSTALGRQDSALEAMCVRPRGNPRLQLARQLTAAALNCAMSNGDPGCEGVSVADDFAECDLACAAGDESMFRSCIKKIDCFNNGGVFEDGMCVIGSCGGDGMACGSDKDCGMSDWGEPLECVRTPGNCHDQPLVSDALGLDFDPAGPASSPKACNQARKNDCTIFNCRSCGGGGRGGHGKGGRGHGGRGGHGGGRR